MPRPTARPLAAVPPEEGRLVTDPATQHVWFVCEMDAAGVPGARGERCLVFDTVGQARRVWSYPADWTTLPDPDLLAVGAAWRPPGEPRAARAEPGRPHPDARA